MSTAWRHPATVIASLALFVPLGGGTALASGLGGLISGKRIVDRSIAERKLSWGAIRALGSHAYVAAAPGATPATPLPVKGWVALKTLTLPAGSYVVIGKTTLGTPSTRDVHCALDYETSGLGGVIDDLWSGGASSGQEWGPLNLAGTAASGDENIQVTLACRSYQPNASVSGSNIVAIKVGSITGPAPGPDAAIASKDQRRVR